ncbi:MAG: DNA helicase IV [Paracrocinitomix sp.]|jgi:DNA helicase IV
MSDVGSEQAALDELEAERRVIDGIALAREAQIKRVAARASRLAEEAAAMTEDGLRDIFDEDDDPDAAVQATFVREGAMYAMAAAKRFHEVDSVGDAPAFGRITDEAGQDLYVGKCSVIDSDEVLLVDWRARAAIPFYRATPLEPLGVVHRRHLHYSPESAPPRELVGYSDEVFDTERLGTTTGLQGEAALLASLETDRTGQMSSVVATIQAEQDAVIRADSNEPLLVQGGPGTGKTVVALHRAAYLLYDQRQALAENGVLIVGPSTHFLAYISEVLPSLGETGVVSAVPAQLYPGVRKGLSEPVEVSAIKGQAEMVTLLANSVRNRQIRPTRDLLAWYGSDRVTMSSKILQECFDEASRLPSHNEAADRFRMSVIEAFSQQVYNPSFDNYGEAYRSFAASPSLKIFLLKHWPTLTPEQALNDLLGSPALLRKAAAGSGLSRAQVALLGRERVPEMELEDNRWSDADIPLLDELWHLVGGLPSAMAEEDRQRVRDARDEFEIAAMQDQSLEDEDGEPVEDEAAEILSGLVLPPPPIRGDFV